MFDNQSPNFKPGQAASTVNPQAVSQTASRRKVIMIIIIAVVVLGLLVAGYIWGRPYIWPEEENALNIDQEIPSGGDGLDTSGGAQLPGDTNGGNGGVSSSGLGAEVEYLAFKDFYKPLTVETNFNLPKYKLPWDAKTQAINYYDFSRQISLDAALTALNSKAFVVIKNPFSSQKGNESVNNFYAVYDTLSKRQVPPLLTSDFLTYHYQTALKQVFKNIEADIFYSNLFEMLTNLNETAKARYQKRLGEVGQVNDLVLEAARLEVAYTATALELLKPQTGQINTDDKTVNPNLFTPAEATFYTFNSPGYLRVDALKEVELIKEHRQNIKSPVMLYPINYADFVVPDDYKANAKLNNFYLTARWLNQPFPLYYQNNDCPNCALDIDDWRIHTLSASFMAHDLFNNYDLKLKWARIYKTLAFFKGLRDDLTLVQYRDSLVKTFGENYNLEELLGSQSPGMPDNFNRLQNQLAQYNFSALGGAWDKTSERSKMGVRFLADFYWPNDYLFKQLTSPAVGNYQGTKPAASNNTICKSGTGRCVASVGDMINLVFPLSGKSSYFDENANYRNYQTQAEKIRALLATADLWHGHNYWSTLKLIASSFLTNGRLSHLANSDYLTREINRTMASWVDLQLPLDKLSLDQKYAASDSANTGFLEYSYVEPNLGLVDELINNTEMIKGMMEGLKVNYELSSVNSSLNDLSQQLNTTRSIIVKELNGQDLSNDDVRFIDRLGREFKVETLGKKTMVITGNNKQKLNIDLSDVKILIFAHQRSGRWALSAGPVFNYWEKK
ncbi:MAG TPA: DUF3160 domain-containing protein [bacterium]|nr:DUF3160 domain-containing protein [bacterium]HPT29730.1 DUF3160 domain-containing protein [bacterium]